MHQLSCQSDEELRLAEMKPLLTIFLLQMCIIWNAAGQNYIYIYGKMDPHAKAELSGLVQSWVHVYGMENVTIAVMKCFLPRRVQGTAEYDNVEQLERKMILIRLNRNLTPFQQQEVLAHEMVHAHQMYTGDLVRHDRTTFTWKGKQYHNIDKIQHHRRPWEVEAITQSRLLVVSK